MTKAILLIVDMQNDFVRSDGAMPVPTAEAIIPKVKEVLEFFRKLKLPVIHIVRSHRRDGSDVEISRLKKFKEKGGIAVENSRGAQIIEELAPCKGETILVKKRFSAFLMTELPFILQKIAPEYVVIVGIQTPNCIRHTAIDSLCYNYQTIVVSDAITAATPEIHQANLFDMEEMGISILTLSQTQQLISS